nr:hypothetical protein [Clostridia bacterium]
MKMSKKIIAVVLSALLATTALVALVVSASAADKAIVATAEYDAEAAVVSVTINFENCIGLKSFQFHLNYDAAKLSYKNKKNGADTKLAADTENGALTTEVNGGEAGLVDIGGYFKENLDAEFYEDAEDEVNVENFEALIINFDVLDATGTTEIAVEIISDDSYGLVGQNATVAFSGEEPDTESTTEEPTTEPTTAEPTTEPTTAEPTTEPTTAEPTTAEPTTAEPTTAEPTTADPTTAEPPTAEATTDAPPADP